MIPRWDASGLSASSPGLDAIEKVVFFVKDGFKAAQPYGTSHLKRGKSGLGRGTE